jgi:hypothetical protein
MGLTVHPAYTAVPLRRLPGYRSVATKAASHIQHQIGHHPTTGAFQG